MQKSQKAIRSPVATILSGEVQLGDFVDKMFAMRWRVIRVFVDAGQSDRRDRGRHNRSACGYIANVGDQLSDLATYLMCEMGSWVLDKVYSVDNLPSRYRTESRRDQEYIARYVCHQLVMRQLVLLREAHTLWYQEGWSLPQSVLDEYLLLVKGSKQNYYNQRSFHGRPNRDRRSGYLVGTSVSASR